MAKQRGVVRLEEGGEDREEKEACGSEGCVGGEVLSGGTLLAEVRPQDDEEEEANEASEEDENTDDEGEKGGIVAATERRIGGDKWRGQTTRRLFSKAT